MSDKPGELAETLVADGIRTWANRSAGDPDLDASLPEDLSPGALLAERWELLALIGSGGMGSVYRARDRELDELVAVKVLRRELARAPGMIERFRREVKLARRVTHPNVARTFDIGEAGEMRFLTMELLDGLPLSRLLAREQPMSVARLAPIARAICAGLAAAHRAGVVHRDLKPDNVLLERSGRVAITDFGIARALVAEGGEGDTQGAVVGTPLYMAPEQIAHDAPIGPAADVYALGCMLFELATGSAPWTGPTPLAIAAARLLAPPPDARQRMPELSEAFSELVLRMMARHPGARPASAEEIGEVLTALEPLGAISVVAPFSSARPSAPGSISRTLSRDVTTPSMPWSATKTLAVLPIDNRGDASDAYLAAALTDDLVDLLSASPGLRVRPRAVAERAARAGADGPRDPRDVGRELDVHVVVTGEVRRHGDRLQASVRLLTVEDGFQLWARRFTTEPGQFLQIGDEAAAAIAEALLARPVAPRDAPAPEALDLYLRGRHYLQRTWGASLEAVACLERAFQLAPHDPRICVTYARALVRGFAVGQLEEQHAQTAWRLIDEALQAEPRSSEARLARSALHLMRGEWVAGASDLRAVVEADPDFEEAIALLGDILVDCDAPTAAATLERAIALDPGHFTPRVGLMRAVALGGDFARAREILGPPPADPYDRAAYWVSRSRLAMWAADRDEARMVRAAIAEVSGPGYIRDVLEVTTAVTLGLALPLGVAERATSAMGTRTAPRIATFQAQFRAEILATCHLTDAAFASLMGADAEGSFDVAWADRCPAVEPLRGNPLFGELRNRIAQRAERIRTALGELAGPRGR